MHSVPSSTTSDLRKLNSGKKNFTDLLSLFFKYLNSFKISGCYHLGWIEVSSQKSRLTFVCSHLFFLFRGAIANMMVLAYEGPFHEIFSGHFFFIKKCNTKCWRFTSDTTLVIIFITVTFNGLLTKPLVNCLKLGQTYSLHTRNRV